MIGLLKFLFLDKRARGAMALRATPVPARAAAASPPRERTAAEALADAEERMKRMSPEKAQLIRTAMAVHRVRQTALAELSDEERARLQAIAEKAFLGGGKSG